MGHGVLEATFDGLVVHGECKLTTARGDWVKMFIRKSGEIELCSLYCAGYELVPSSEDTVRATLKFPNGSKYVGALLVARAVGIGELTIPGLGICKGSFFNGFLNGKAGVRFSGGGTLNGTFDGGLLEGPGEYRSGNGTVYIGNFMDGLPCGPGAVFVPGDKADLYLTIKGGEKPSCPEFDETELMSLREALAHFCVAFPAQVVMGVTKVKGKGLFISSVISDALPDGGEPFSVVEVPADDSTANADEAKAA
jgi:hypothetical protein